MPTLRSDTEATMPYKQPKEYIICQDWGDKMLWVQTDLIDKYCAISNPVNPQTLTSLRNEWSMYS